MNPRTSSLLLVLVFLSGCATGSHNYTPPTIGLLTAQNFKEVDKPKEEVWNELITGLSGQFFVINTMDKSSGFINVSYSGDPEHYVDGGELDFKVSNLRGSREYQFPATRANTKYEVFQNGILAGINRSVNLEGRMNVVVSEISPTRTRVAVHTRYILTVSAVIQAVTGEVVTPSPVIVTFDTGNEGHSQSGYVYRPTGELENSVLELIK